MTEEHSAKGNDLGYNGMKIEPAAGWVNYGFRDYTPELARFTTIDPIKDGLSWFAYVGNEPINNIDRWGLSASDAGGDRTTPEPTIPDTDVEVYVLGIILDAAEIFGGVAGIITGTSGLTTTTVGGVLVGDDTVAPAMAIVYVNVIKASLVSIGVGIATIDAALDGETFDIPAVIKVILQ